MMKIQVKSVNMDDIVESTVENFIEKATEVLKDADADTLPEILHLMENLWIAFMAELNRAFIEVIHETVRQASKILEKKNGVGS